MIPIIKNKIYFLGEFIKKVLYLFYFLLAAVLIFYFIKSIMDDGLMYTLCGFFENGIGNGCD
jgi:hypothetical protein|tara:strand:+ start:363 stop:548 length:186 start_codon:yes stop_codon:yes gene_type:complete